MDVQLRRKGPKIVDAKVKTVDEYIHQFDGIAKVRLINMREIVRRQLPDAEERISYNMPAYFLNKKLIVYFAGYKNHVGMYPGRTKSEAYNKLASKYASGKSTARFPHDEPLPKDIIEKFIDVRLKEAKRITDTA